MNTTDAEVIPNMRSILCKYPPLAALLLFAAGCVNVDYVGQTFEPIPEGTPVAYFENRGDIRPGKYRIIGRAVITTTRRMDKYDIRELLVDEARKRGADAVVTVELKQIKRGIYERETDTSVNDIAPALNSGTVKPDGEPLDIPFGPAEPLESEHHYRTELKMRVLFLKDKEALEQQLARRGRELDRLVKQPDPAQGSPEKKDSAPTP